MRRSPAHTGRLGFTVVEVIVALIVLAVGILAMAGTTSLLVRQVTVSRATTVRASALQSTVEKLRGTDFDLITDGTHTLGPFTVTWTVTDTSPVKTVEIVTAGPGLAGTPPTPTNNVIDTFTYKVVRR